MVRLALVHSRVSAKSNSDLSHRASSTEGEAAHRLMEAQGYVMKRKSTSERGQQSEWRCPFHEGPGAIEPRKGTNFYINATTSQYACHSASCGERGNLQTLERFFGIDVADDDYVEMVSSKEQQLQLFEKLLTPELRTPFYEHGLTDLTIERFRLGYEPEHTEPTEDGRGRKVPARYVIPYLEGRRPVLFRYYAPYGEPKYKYTWETGSEARLFNASAAIGDDKGMVILAEGEQKAMLLTQLGYAAVAVPGAAMWRTEWQAAFTHAKQILICFDHDNPEHHIYDKPEQDKWCQRCKGKGLERCAGHNPGQEAAAARLDSLGWRAKNIVLPLPEGKDAPKTDVNDFFVRDGHTGEEFAELATGKPATPYKVASLADIMLKPPEATQFLIEQGILPRGGRLLIAGAPKVGKMQRTSSPVLTPHGWTTMGDLHVGDEVISVDGTAARVIAVHPQGVKKIFKVTMSDGSWTECGLDHLWTIQSHDQRQRGAKSGRQIWETVDTEQIAALLAAGKTRHTYIPMVAPVQYAPNGVMPLDPYGLGLLIGDGNFTTATPRFTKPEPELHEALAKAFPDNAQSMVNEAKGDMNLRSKTGPNVLTAQLRQLGLWGCKSTDKFLPEQYLRADVDTRLALLQGLLDTDGWVQWNASKKNSSAYFGTSSERLKDHVVELVESLGGTVRVLHKPAPKFQNGGVGAPAWSLRVRLPEEFEPFRLTRKLEEWRSGRTSKFTPPVRKIVAVEYVGDDEAQCITIDRDHGLYVTERFIVTHNSVLADNLALSLAAGIPFLGRFAVDQPTRTLLLDRELSRWSLFSRLQELMDKRLGYRAAAENLLVDHDHLIRLDQKGAYDVLANLVESNGAEVIILDTAYKFFSGDVESAASVSKAFEVLDKVIHTTGVSVVMTHHMRKRQSKDPHGAAAADPSQVVGSFLWTGWPNATILLNFLNRSVEDPFNALCSFTAFRDAAPPDPLALYRTRESIAYSAISDYSYDEENATSSGRASTQVIRPDTESVANLLLQVCPTTEEDFLHIAGAHFGVKMESIRPFLLDALSGGHFEKSKGRPAIIKFAHDRNDEQTWEAEHNLPATPPPPGVAAPGGITAALGGAGGFVHEPMFDAAMDLSELSPADF